MFCPTMHPSRKASTRRGSATPAFAPRVRHSPSSRSMLIASALWTSLVIDPAPSSPTQTTLFENVSSTGFTRCRTASSPPTNSVTFPSSAPSRPPSSGASSRCAPRAFRAAPPPGTTLDPSRGTRLLRQQSFGPPDHHDHEHQADENLLRRGEPHARQERDDVLRESAAFEKAEEHGRAEERAAVVATAPEYEREPDKETFLG